MQARKQPVSTAGALTPRSCRCDQPIVDEDTCWKCGHPVKPNAMPAGRPRPERGPVDVKVDPSWDRMARMLEGK